MAALEKSVPNLPVVNSAVITDRSVVVANGATSLLPVGFLPSSNTPANSIATVITGGRSWTDGNYLYVATSNNVVKRAILSSF